jgi:hypothetical protein
MQIREETKMRTIIIILLLLLIYPVQNNSQQVDTIIIKSNINKPILFNSVTRDTILVPFCSNCQVLKISVILDSIIHPSVSDLRINLNHGPIVSTLANHCGTSGNNFIRITLTDTAVNPICFSLAPGYYRPFQPLNTFVGQPPSGHWILSILDDVPGDNPASGDTGWLDSWCLVITYSSMTGISNIKSPSGYSLNQNYPNPFNPSTLINYSLASDGNVSLTIYDITGREVTKLVNEFKSAGDHSVDFDAELLPGGVYFYTLRSEGFEETKKMLMVK